jgi:hypothetical protein
VPASGPIDLVHVPASFRQESHKAGKHLAFRLRA